MNLRKRCLLLASFLCLAASAQWRWINPLGSGQPAPPDQTIYFYSNAPEIKIKHTAKGAARLPELELYSIDADGEWQYHPANHVPGDTTCTFGNLGKEMYHNHGREYRLYLPAGCTAGLLEIGVPEGSEYAGIPLPEEKPVVVCGTRTTQKVFAPVVRRRLDYPLLCLDLPGDGEQEEETLRLLSETDARLFILDPSACPEAETGEEAARRLSEMVRRIRRSHQAPILLSEYHPAYDRLAAEGVRGLYYISEEEAAASADRTSAAENKLRALLHLPEGSYSTQRPVSQRREPDMYEWKSRHRAILSENRENPPRAVILGNSITHYWGGVDDAPRKNGPESWEQQMRPAGFHNQGCGWDRIENVLWRVYHDELGGFEAEKIVLMIGTNNLDLNNDEEIASGIRLLLTAIRQRQPKAAVKLIGIFPRRGKEERIRRLNRQLAALAEEGGYLFSDPGQALLLDNGKIDERLFGDGLHPNGEGYARLGQMIAE